MLRALLIVNPKATATSTRVRDVLARALGSELKVDVAPTERRGHAADLAREAAADGIDVVVTLGGDGTVNEAVNGLLTAPVDPGPDADPRPLLAVVPGGSANVFARSLGLPVDPVEATSALLDALQAGSRRWVGLGRADDRWFTFCAGLGIDAEVVRAVEAGRRGGARATPGRYLRTTVRQFFASTNRTDPALTLHLPDAAPTGPLALAFVSNSAPWTYLGERPINPSPQASFDSGLDLFALRRLRTLSGGLVGAQFLRRSPQRSPRSRQVLALHDLDRLRLTASRPLAFQVDGEYLGERSEMTFRSVPRALAVVVPPAER